MDSASSHSSSTTSPSTTSTSTSNSNAAATPSPTSTSSTDPTSSTASTAPTTIRLFAALVGEHAFSADVERGAPIETLLAELQTWLKDYKMPYEFTAYTSKRGKKWIDYRTTEYDDIRDGRLDVAAKYLKPAARLDPKKTVADYFGDAPFGYTIHMVLKWSPAAEAQRKVDLARERQQQAKLVREYKEQQKIKREREREQEQEAKRQLGGNWPQKTEAHGASGPWSPSLSRFISSLMGNTTPTMPLGRKTTKGRVVDHIVQNLLSI